MRLFNYGGEEHYILPHKMFTCSGAPIHDPNGRVIGALCFSGSKDTVQPHTLSTVAMVANMIELQLKEQSVASSNGAALVYTFKDAIGNCPKMQTAKSLGKRIAGRDSAVLIRGESGTGKEIFAQSIHSSSYRSNGPFAAINCGAIPENLIESELFGYEAGAFTGASHKGKEGRIALADKGTLFLDEIGELPLRLQSKLLQVIQEKQIVKLGGGKPVSIDFRLVAATNQDLEALVEKKRFRSDLFFRLNVLPLWIPPLRERREEIVPLCLSILGEMNAKYGTEKVFSDEVKRHLAAYSWPGNIRELRNVIERLPSVSSGGVIKADELPEHMFRHQENQESPIGKSLPDALETLERRMILEAYKACGTTTGVAKALGISQPTAARKIAKYKNEASGER